MIADEELLRQLAECIHGEIAGKVIELLVKAGEATDEEIAEKLGIGVNDVRRILNALFESNLVKYRRIRDEKLGWFTYFWRITDDSVESVLKYRVSKTIEKLRARLEYERSSTFYVCPKCGRRYTFDEAADSMFTCLKCEVVLEPFDNARIVRKLEEAIELLEEVRGELEIPRKLVEAEAREKSKA